METLWVGWLIIHSVSINSILRVYPSLRPQLFWSDFFSFGRIARCDVHHDIGRSTKSDPRPHLAESTYWHKKGFNEVTPTQSYRGGEFRLVVSPCEAVEKNSTFYYSTVGTRAKPTTKALYFEQNYRTHGGGRGTQEFYTKIEWVAIVCSGAAKSARFPSTLRRSLSAWSIDKAWNRLYRKGTISACEF